MLRKTLIGAVAAIVITVTLGGAAPASAVYPAGKTFFGYWEFNLFGNGLQFFGDCVRFTNNRVCSALVMGKCGPFQITGTDGANTFFTGQIRKTGFLLGGNVKLTAGTADRRSLGGTVNAVHRFKAPGFTRGNGSIDLHEDVIGICDGIPFPGAGPTETIRDYDRQGPKAGSGTELPDRD